MTNNDSDKLSDKELEEYLDGGSEVSRAYQALDKTSSPAELDAKILARARESAAETRRSRGDIDRFSRPYRVAATLFLCVTIAFMVVNEPPPSGSETLDENRIIQPQTAPTAAEEQEADFQAAREVAEPQPAQAPAANVASDDAAAREGAAAELRAEGAALQEQAGAATADADRQGLAGVANAARLAQPGYRDNREDWLAEIQRLRDNGENEQAALEAELFRENFPDADLEAALEGL